MSRPRRLYRVLLKLYPAGFRTEFAAPLERQFLDEYRETRTRAERAAFWLRTLVDLVRSVPGQVAREFRADVRYALRVYSRRPIVTLLAVTALALAIGATTGVFSVVNAVLLRSLPFGDAARLVQLSPGHGIDTSRGFHQWRRESRYLADAVNYDRTEMNLTLGATSARVAVTETSSNFFSMLGAPPAVGRGFLNGEDVKGAELVAVIGYGLSQQLFGGDRAALGRHMTLNGRPVTVVGVAEPGFDYPGRTAVWVPTTFAVGRLPKSTVTVWETIGRIKKGVSLAQAGAMFAADHAGEKRPVPKGYERPRPRLVPLRERLAGPVQQASLVLMGAAVFVLLIACANVANLLLTRMNERRSELAIRSALGASRGRLVQQLITESLALSFVAAIAGLVVATLAARLATAAQPAQLALQQYRVLDGPVLGFAVALAVFTALVFGVGPAVVAGRLQPADTLVRSQGGAHHGGAGRVRRVLLGAQVALTIVLLAGASVMGRSFLALVGTDLGFRPDGVITMNVSLAGTRHDTDDRRSAYFREALTRLLATPGVHAAGATDFLPLTSLVYGGGGFTVEDGRAVDMATQVSVTPGYFQTLAVPLLFGRDFQEADGRDGEPVAIVNDAFAREAGADRALIGKRITTRFGKTSHRIVGIVRSGRTAGPASGVSPQVFVPSGGLTPLFMTFVARVENPESVLSMARDALQRLDPQVPVFEATTLEAHLRTVLAKPRFYTTTILFLGGLAVLLSMIGVYGVSSYAVVQRRHEIGVRLAIGATGPAVRSMLLRQSLLPVAAGFVAGIPAAFAATRYLRHLLSTVQPLDVATCTLAALLLAVVAAVTVWTAISRVLESNPLDTLKAE